MEKAATLVMLQPPTPARKSTAWIHAPSQPFDAITAFAVPNPGSSSQSQSVFSGLVALQVARKEQITQPTSDWQGLFRQSFQPSTKDKLNSCLIAVNAKVSVKTKYL
jgi:hypothetical protein